MNKKVKTVIAVVSLFAGFVLIMLQLGFFGTVLGLLLIGFGAVLLVISQGIQKGKKGKRQYVRSKSSDTFHKPSCRVARMIDQKNLQVYTNETAQHLRSIGLKPCVKCKPR